MPLPAGAWLPFSRTSVTCPPTMFGWPPSTSEPHADASNRISGRNVRGDRPTRATTYQPVAGYALDLDDSRGGVDERGTEHRGDHDPARAVLTMRLRQKLRAADVQEEADED